MNYLQYKSNEMYSSTQLVRKSKTIFDKLELKEIEKAVILRDGKPSFIMMDFELYEDIMNDYVNLKSISSKENKEINELNINQNKEIIENKSTKKEEVSMPNNVPIQTKMDKLLSKLDSIDGIINNDTDEKPENLKEFWE